MTDKEEEWFNAYLNGEISEADFESLQERLAESSQLRTELRKYLAVTNYLEREAVVDTTEAPGELNGSKSKYSLLIPFTIALAVIGAMIWMYQQGRSSANGGDHISLSENSEEPSAEGFAVVKELSKVVWKPDSKSFRASDMLGKGLFRVESGVAEIQFFSGAEVTIEGPASLEIISAWEAKCLAGRLRVKVPPAARGFKLHGPDTEIVDLGTEFGFEVADGLAKVEVFDGEISFRHRSENERLVETGAAWQLPSSGKAALIEPGSFLAPVLDPRKTSGYKQSYANWQEHRDKLSVDPRVIAYYTFDDDINNGLVSDLKNSHDGSTIIAQPVAGRWPRQKGALDFRKPGSRVRVNIPGEFSAFTFMCWVRIDSLDRWYNALFMGDGYETGEPHWQIRNDGKLMLSVMVDDSKPNPGSPKDAGFHRVYFSEPFWDQSKSGQWFHLCSVFDPKQRQVRHFVNGEKIHEQEIAAQFFIDKFRIGNAELGNWGQPFRKNPWFAIRNLNGRMDELVIFDAALSDDEIQQLFLGSQADSR